MSTSRSQLSGIATGVAREVLSWRAACTARAPAALRTELVGFGVLDAWPRPGIGAVAQRREACEPGEASTLRPFMLQNLRSLWAEALELGKHRFLPEAGGCFECQSTLEATQGQILSQSSKDATQFW